MATTVEEILNALIASEKANDAHQMSRFLDKDFRFIGPAGFVLTATQFAARFDGGKLKTTMFNLTNLDIRERGDAAVAEAIWTQESTYDGNSSDGSFRFIGVFIQENEGWRMLNGQLSPMAVPQV